MLTNQKSTQLWFRYLVTDRLKHVSCKISLCCVNNPFSKVSLMPQIPTYFNRVFCCAMVLSAPSWSQVVEPQCSHFSKLKGLWSSSLYSVTAYSRRPHLFPCGIDIELLFGWDSFLQGLNKPTQMISTIISPEKFYHNIIFSFLEKIYWSSR